MAVQEFQASLVAMQHVADALAQQHAQCSAASALRSLGWQVWLGIVAVAGHTQQLLSGADVAALLLSRRLLLQRDPFKAPNEVTFNQVRQLCTMQSGDTNQSSGCSNRTPLRPPMS